MGPFEIAPGTQWDHGDDFDHGQFPPMSAYGRYEALAQRKYPQGDISARSALTVHRGTRTARRLPGPSSSSGSTPGAGNDAHHDLAVTKEFWTGLPQRVRDHLDCPVVDELSPNPAEARHRGPGDGLRRAAS